MRSVVARARNYLLEAQLIEAAMELYQLATDLGLDEIGADASAARASLKRIEEQVLQGLQYRDAEPDRFRIHKLLLALCKKLEEAAKSRAPEGRDASPSRAPPRRERAASHGPDEPPGGMVECVDVVKRYGPRFTVGKVSFTLLHGEILAVVGTNASGKTTLLRILAEELAPDEGSCAVSRHDAGERPLNIPSMFIPESPPPWAGRMDVYLSWQAAIFGYRARKENERRVNFAIRQLDIEEHRHKRWTELSDGIRMRAAMAVAMLANPGLIILDEPLGQLDPRSQQDLLRWVRVYAKRARKTSFVISAHQVTEIEAVADKILSLAPGKACSAIAPALGAAPEGRFFRIEILPGADRAELFARLAGLGEDVTYVDNPSYVLVKAAPGAALDLARLAASVEGASVISIQDLSRSSLRALLWGGQ